MRRLALGTLTLVAALVVTDSAFAQGMGMGMGNMMPPQGVGSRARGMQNVRKPKRKLHKNNSPALSPALNMLPETATTFEGQFLMRQLPQEQFINSTQQNAAGVANLQNQISDQETEIKSGLSKTGHVARFMNYGGYYGMGGGGGGGGGRRRRG